VHRRNQQRLSTNLVHAADRAKSSLDAEAAGAFSGQTFPFFSVEIGSAPLQSRLIEFAQRAAENLQFDFSCELLFLFLSHAAILPKLSLLERSQPSQVLRPAALMDLVSKRFLPQVFFLASHLPFDIDGRVFLSLISTVTLHRSIPFPDIVGPIVYDEVRAVWAHVSLAIPDFSTFRRKYAAGGRKTAKVSAETIRGHKLLPFNHPVFNFDSMFLPDTAVEEETPTTSSYLGFGVTFSDTTHWHNSRSILPSHLGGEDYKVLDERQRRRENRSNQRFMTTLQKSAATLTGALGTSLQQITIVSVAKKPLKDSRVPKVETCLNHLLQEREDRSQFCATTS
jgi:hypothetical protein